MAKVKGTTNKPAVCVLLRNGNKVLLILRGDINWKPHEYVTPSGHVEEKETFTAGAVREVKEETGLRVSEKDLQFKAMVHRQSPLATWVDVYFEADHWEGEPQVMEPENHVSLDWFDIDKLPANTADYVKYGIDLIRQGKTYGEFGWGTDN